MKDDLGRGRRAARLIVYDLQKQILQSMLLIKMQRGDEKIVKLWFLYPLQFTDHIVNDMRFKY